MLLFHVTFTVSDHIFYIFHVVFLLPLHPLSCLCQTFNQKSWCVRACLTQTHTIVIIMIRTAFFISFHSSYPIILISKADLQLSEASIWRIFLIIWDPTFQTFTTEVLWNLSHRAPSPGWMHRDVQRWQTKLKACEYIKGAKITVASHLLTCSYLPHFPTSTSLYFPLTLANLSRQWVAGIHFHPVVALESPFSKQHDITKTIAKGRF